MQHRFLVERQPATGPGQGSWATLDKIVGVQIVKLQPNRDSRGSFTEIFRDEWDIGCRPAQWNVDHSRAGTMRGVHAHRRRYDYVSILWGRMFLALHDGRRNSPTFGLTVAEEVRPDDGHALILPPGVAHGLYYPEDSVTLIGFSVAWDPADDIRCHHAARELRIEWPGRVEHVSDADAAAPGYEEFLRALNDEQG